MSGPRPCHRARNRLTVIGATHEAKGRSFLTILRGFNPSAARESTQTVSNGGYLEQAAPTPTAAGGYIGCDYEQARVFGACKRGHWSESIGGALR